MITNFDEFIAYFENLSTLHNGIKYFMHGGVGRIVSDRLVSGGRSAIQYPLLFLEWPEMPLDEDNNVSMTFFKSAFVILDNSAHDDWDGQDAVMQSTFKICQDVLIKMKLDSKGANRKFNFNSKNVRIEPLDNVMIDNAFGWRVEFEIKVYSDLTSKESCYDMSVWQQKTRKIADFANINSVTYLELLVNNFIEFGYECTSFKYNNVVQPTSVYYAPGGANRSLVPTQQAPRITIPAYAIETAPGTESIQYDANWIDFLTTLLADTGLKVYPSPFDDLKDNNYPTAIRDSANVVVGLKDASGNNVTKTYGEGFSLDWAQGDTFEIIVQMKYGEVVGHVMKFTEQGTWFDGAFVQSPQNMITYTL